MLTDRYQYMLAVMDGLSPRLAALARLSDDTAQACRTAALTGGGPVRAAGLDRYDDELLALSPLQARAGSVTHWEALDPALTHLAAIYKLDDAAAHADAHEAISITAGQLAGDANSDVQTGCFRRHGVDEVDDLLAGSDAAICARCVQTCHDRLYDV